LNVLYEMQAYDRKYPRFPFKTKARIQAQEHLLVRLDHDMLHPSKTFQPPRMVTYGPAELRILEGTKWEVEMKMETGGRKVRKGERKEKDECWELSAVPWLAATGSDVSEDEQGEGVFQVPEVRDMQMELFVALYSQIKVSEETERVVWGDDGMLGRGEGTYLDVL